MPGSALRRLALVAACVLLGACEPLTDPVARSPRRLLVQSVLNAGLFDQFVIVEWTERTLFGPTTPVSGATVTLTTPQGFIAVASEESDTLFGDGGPRRVVYRFGIPGFALEPGGTYTLHVRTPTGEEASGTTTVPLVPPGPVIVEEFPILDRLRDTVRLAWRRVPGAKSYQLAVRSEIIFSQSCFEPPHDCPELDNPDFVFRTTFTQFADTSATLAGTARTRDNDPVFRQKARVNISVWAVDENYYDYYHPTVDPFAGAPPSKLTGAIGVFGSVATVRAWRYLDVR